ncbi:MAG TPA: sigma-54 dependent transcriptional regulator [Candidatus Polarisedimenticolaceae bacterium]|nr:sigma-54 dependent transcriptional regulator [Candidatus Polarisedimenticolaceae bacterium]
MSKVLVVEDQPAVAGALEVLFHLHDLPCVVAGNVDAAVRQVQGGEIGAVLQDMNFSPGATGGEEGVALFRRLRESDPGLPILLMTAWTSLETAVQLVKEGATDYMAKPWDDAKLVATVRALLQAHAPRREDARALCGLVHASEAMERVVSLAVQVGPSDVPVLITGENGAGKDKIAEIVHAASSRGGHSLVRVNVGALPDDLLESELFGAEPGAYTGATRLRIGRFEAAHRGTLFLDEIGNLSAAGQAKLLRVLQSGEFERLGASQTRRADVRVLCATNADLQAEIAAGRFRQDLYFRVAVVEIEVPPLRARREDILLLAEHFLKGSGRRLDPAARDVLLEHAWPGNVRELQNRVQRAVAVGRGETILPADLGFESTEGMAGTVVPEERTRIEAALRSAGGSVSRAAEALGLSRQALYRRMEKLGIVMERRPR